MNIVKHWQQFHFRINVPIHKYAVFNLHSVSLARIKRACVQPALFFRRQPLSHSELHSNLVQENLLKGSVYPCGLYSSSTKASLFTQPRPNGLLFSMPILEHFFSFFLEGGQGHSVLHQICSVTSLSLSLH